MTAQERLFAPPREPAWCPMRNCGKRCDPCTCPPCRCPSCAARRRGAAGGDRPQVSPLEFFAHVTRQPRLFYPIT